MFQAALSMLIQLSLFSLAMAAPVAIESSGHGNTWQYGAGGGTIGFIVLILDILVFMEILKSDRPVSHKVLWCVGVFLFPILGLIVYWLFSDRSTHMSGGDYEPIA